jgi:Site-specific recombinases, DNA invertase Pin homologs
MPCCAFYYTINSKEWITIQTYGYARVSSHDQNEGRQLDALRDIGIAPKHIFTDKQSGKDFERPAYLRLVKRLRPGDLLYIKSIDRLGRNYEEIQDQWRVITKDRSVDIVVIDMPLLDTRSGKDLMGTFIADLVLQILCFVAHSERDSIHKRQAEGIAAAKARGVTFGRPPKSPPVGYEEMRCLYQNGAISLNKAGAQLGVSKNTFKAWIDSGQ